MEDAKDNANETKVTATGSKPEEKDESSSDSSSSDSDSSDSDSETTKSSDAPADSKKRKAETEVGNESKKAAVDGGDNLKMFIRGLPWRATEDEVREYFQSCGEITFCELPLNDDGRSSGTGKPTLDSIIILF